MLYEMLAREIPFFSRHNPDWKFKHHVENAVLKGLRPPVDKEEIEKFFSVQIDTQIFELLKSCWHQDPIKRPTFQICVKICSTLLQPFWSQVNQVVNKSQMIIPSLDLPEKETQSVQSSTDIVKIEKIGTNKHYSNINYFKCSIKTWNGVGFLKELNFSNVKGTEEALIQFFNEMKIFKFLSSKGGHPNLIQMVGQYQDKNVIDLVLEYYGGGTLESLIYQRKNQPFSNLEIAQFAVQILRGLNFLHHKKIAHRTLKVIILLQNSFV